MKPKTNNKLHADGAENESVFKKYRRIALWATVALWVCLLAAMAIIGFPALFKSKQQERPNEIQQDSQTMKPQSNTQNLPKDTQAYQLSLIDIKDTTKTGNSDSDKQSMIFYSKKAFLNHFNAEYSEEDLIASLNRVQQTNSKTDSNIGKQVVIKVVTGKKKTTNTSPSVPSSSDFEIAPVPKNR
jgi:hypothetical protein